MPQTIQVEGGQSYEFPDEASQDEIMSFLRKEYAPKLDRTAKKADLLKQQAAARREGALASAGLTAAQLAEGGVGTVAKMNVVDAAPRAATALAQYAGLVPKDSVYQFPDNSGLVDAVTPSADTIQAVTPLSRANAERLAGVAQAGGDFTKFFLTPEGIATLGAGAAPQLAARALASGFAGQMISSVPELATEAGAATGDNQAQARALANLGLSTVLPAGIVAGGMRVPVRRAMVTPEEVRQFEEAKAKDVSQATADLAGVELAPDFSKEGTPVVEPAPEPVAPVAEVAKAEPAPAEVATPEAVAPEIATNEVAPVPIEPPPVEPVKSVATDETGTRQYYPNQMDPNPLVSDAVKQGVSNRDYTILPNETSIAAAQRIIGERGVDNATRTFFDRTVDMPEAYRVKLGAELAENLARQEKAAQEAGNPVLARELIEKQIELHQRIAERGTDIGQGLQAYTFDTMSPAAKVVWAEKQINSAGKSKFNRVKPAVDVVRNAFKEANDAAATDTLQQPEVERAITRLTRQGISDAGMKLDKIVRQRASDVTATGKNLAAKIAAEMGLDAEQSAKLASLIEKEFQDLATTRKQAILDRLKKPAREVTKQKGLTERLIELTNMGAFDDKSVYDAVREKLKLPVFSESFKREIYNLAEDIQAAPEGIAKRRAIKTLLNKIDHAGGMKWTDLMLSIRYGNMLSGITTPVKNIAANTMYGVAEGVLGAALDPKATPQLIGGMLRGGSKGLLDAKDVMKSGIVTGTASHSKLEAGHFAESATGWRGKALALSKFTGRHMNAADQVAYKMAEELRGTRIMREVAKREGLTGEALRQRTFDLLNETEAKRAAAEGQASAEGIEGLDYKRRVEEILEQGREANAPGYTELVHEFGLRSTFTNKPYGLLGDVANAFNTQMSRWAESESVPARTAAFVGKVAVPFVNIVANVYNAALNWGPVGLYRAFESGKTGELYGKPRHPSDAKDLYVKGALATLAISALIAKHIQNMDKRDPEFEITGSGPRDFNKQQQLRESGWLPYAIKIGGKYRSYMWTPLAATLAPIGNVMDAYKYKTLDESDNVLTVGAYGAMAAWQTAKDMTMLKGIADLYDAVNQDNKKVSLDKLLATGVKQASSFVVPNLLKQLDTIDQQVTEGNATSTMASNPKAALLASFPFVRREGKPVLNALGEPIHSNIFGRDFQDQGKDPVWKLITQRQLWLPMADKERVMPATGKPMSEDQYYRFTKQSGQMIKQSIIENIADLNSLPLPEAKKLMQKLVLKEREEVLKDMGLK